MSVLVDQIAVVVARHSPVTGLGYSRTRCGCGEVFSAPYVKSHAMHVAEQIAEATEPDVDEVAQAIKKAANVYLSDADYRRIAEAALRVSAWSAVEEKP